MPHRRKPLAAMQLPDEPLLSCDLGLDLNRLTPFGARLSLKCRSSVCEAEEPDNRD